MKNYKITVNGYEYDVTVEETGATTPVATKKAAPAPVAAPKAASAPSTGAAGSVKVSAPMPGKILAVKVSNGASVKKGDVLFVLEAMKMENEIVAPQDGTIAGINVNEGASVEAGALLASMN